MAGVYGLPVLLALLVSGIYFNLPDQFAWVVARFSPLSPPLVAPPADGARTMVSIDDLLAAQRETATSGRLATISISQPDKPVLEACFSDVAELRTKVLTTRCFSFARQTGALLRISDAQRGSAGDTFMQWQWPLHSGQAFGAVGRGLVFALGLACPLLAGTGLIRYLQKRRGARQLAARQIVG